jgi:hypothetical protein
MSFFKKIGSALNPFEGEVKTDSSENIDVNQDLAPQMNNTSGSSPINVIGQSPVYAPQPIFNSQPLIPQEEREKWQVWFQNLFSSNNDPKPSYHEFIAMTDSMGPIENGTRHAETDTGQHTCISAADGTKEPGGSPGKAPASQRETRGGKEVTG